MPTVVVHMPVVVTTNILHNALGLPPHSGVCVILSLAMLTTDSHVREEAKMGWRVLRGVSI